MTSHLDIWVVYDRPQDYPGQVVARKWMALQGEVLATSVVITGNTVDDVRAQIPPGLFCQPRDENDDPHIIECWF